MASKAQKALKAGPTSVGAKARAAANKLKDNKPAETKTEAPKASPDKTQPSKRDVASSVKIPESKGKHAKNDYTALKKNTAGNSSTPSIGKHSRETAAARKAAAATPPKPASQSKGKKMSLKEAVSARLKSRKAGISK